MTGLAVSPADYEMSSHERKYLTFDFAADLGSNTIDAADARMVAMRTGVGVPSGVLDGTPIISGSVVGQWIDHPPAELQYRLTIHVTLSDGTEIDPYLSIRVPY